MAYFKQIEPSKSPTKQRTKKNSWFPQKSVRTEKKYDDKRSLVTALPVY